MSNTRCPAASPHGRNKIRAAARIVAGVWLAVTAAAFHGNLAHAFFEANRGAINAVLGQFGLDGL